MKINKRKHVKYYLTQERQDNLDKMRDIEGHMPYTKVLDLCVENNFRWLAHKAKKKKKLEMQLKELS